MLILVQYISCSLSAQLSASFPYRKYRTKAITGGGALVYATRKQIRYGTEAGQLFPAFYPVIGIDYKARRNFNMALDLRPMTRLLGKRPNSLTQMPILHPTQELVLEELFSEPGSFLAVTLFLMPCG